MVTAADWDRLREGSELDTRRDFAEAFRVGFESADSMDSLNLASCWRTLQDDESSVKLAHDLRRSLAASPSEWSQRAERGASWNWSGGPRSAKAV